MGVRNVDFDTPMERRRFNDSGVFFHALICVNPDMRVSYSPVAAQRGGFLLLVGFPSGWCGGGLRTQERVCTTSL